MMTGLAALPPIHASLEKAIVTLTVIVTTVLNVERTTVSMIFQHLKGTTGKLWQTVAMVFSRFKYKIASLVHKNTRSE